MDLSKTPKGTLFRLFRETFITTSEPYYSRHRGITMVKAHNITTGNDEEIGEVAMYGAHPIKPQETEMKTLSTYAERCKLAATAYLNDINSLECMNFCNDKAYWARMNAGAFQVEVADMLAEIKEK